MILKFNEFYKHYKNGNSFYFRTDEGFDYKVIIEKFKDGKTIDFAIYDNDKELYSFDLLPKNINIDKLFLTILKIINKFKDKFYIIPNTYAKYRLYRILLKKIK